MIVENCVSFPCKGKFCYGCKDRKLKLQLPKIKPQVQRVRLKDYPVIPCPTCGVPIPKPIEWGMIDTEGIIHPGYGVWYHCKKCGDWTIQTKVQLKKEEKP